MERPTELGRKRIWLDAKDCERLNRGEFEAMRGLIAATSYVAHARDDLQKRLECIPGGKQRMSMLLGSIKAITDDIVGTMTVNQCKQLRNTMNDMDIRMVPKLTRMSQNVIFEKDLAKGLIDIAQEKCHGCVEDSESCRSCSLYKILEALIPLEDYRTPILCPYSVTEWID